MIKANRDKASEIEEDIVQTQNSISDTVDKLKERLTPQALMNAILGDEKQGFDQIVSLAKRNPFAVALIGAGAGNGQGGQVAIAGQERPEGPRRSASSLLRRSYGAARSARQ